MRRISTLAWIAFGLGVVLAGALSAETPRADKEASTVLIGHQGAIDAAVFGPDGRQVLTGSADFTAELWEVSSQRGLAILEGHDHRVSAVAFSPDGTRALTASADGTARVWDLSTGNELLKLQQDGGRFTAAAYSPNGRQAITGGNDGIARLWDLRSGAQLRQFTGHAEAITTLAISPDGSRLLTGSTDRTARLWDVASGEEIRSLDGHGALILSVAFDPTGQRVLTGSWDKTAILWDAETGMVLRRFSGHDAAIRAVAFSPDGKLVLTGEWNRMAYLWDADSGEELRVLDGHGASIDAVDFAPDGRTVLTASWDGTVRLWPVPEPLWPAPEEKQPAAAVAAVTPAPQPAVKPARKVAVAHPDMLVLIIGNRTYAEAPPVAYAHNDADAFAAYFRDILQVPEDNIIVEKDLNSIGMARYFGTDEVPDGRLARRARFVDEIVVVYSGHGVPVFHEEGLPSGYLLPVDVPAAEPGFGAYPLDMLIRQLETLPVKSITVLLDACFSGLSTQGSLVPGVSGAFGVAVAPPQEKAKVSVLTATDFRTPQFAHWLEDKKHGAFTYYTLDGLRGAADSDGDGRIRLSELRDHIDEKLAQQDLRQSPSLLPGSQDNVLTEYRTED
ncbi:caspase family protein [Mameliella alba]|nr:caspase family protein [Antarctobacter heliothermus]MBY6144360.1 caspase family protein [Mameliella alba]MCA0954409.1 caspase family protein [Mameliella alba]